jgi:hypothetical protein
MRTFLFLSLGFIVGWIISYWIRNRWWENQLHLRPKEMKIDKADLLVPFETCPKCKKPFEPFMRGKVYRPLAMVFRWLPSSALICYECKEIVAWE